MEEIKDRLKKALDERNMLSIELARKSGINKGTISRYLRGEVIPKQSAIGAMAEALSVSPAWLMGYDLTMDGKKKIEIDVTRLNEINQAKLVAYFQALVDSQED